MIHKSCKESSSSHALCKESSWIFVFFQAEDGIRDWSVTGVQTCALPISYPSHRGRRSHCHGAELGGRDRRRPGGEAKGIQSPRGSIHSEYRSLAGRIDLESQQIGRASCRERV